MADEKLIGEILKSQRNEITEYNIYNRLARGMRDAKNKKILEQIGKDELRHYNYWKGHSEKDVKPSGLKIWFYYLISKIFGLTFGVKLMEMGEGIAQNNYKEIAKAIPEAEKIEKEEQKHEMMLLGMINEEKLKYVGSIVLGLNDALVELLGAVAGLTLAFQKTSIVAIAGLITGIAASFSMAASEFLSTKAEGGKDALKSSVYTGIAYIITVMLLVLPYFFALNPFVALGCMFFIALLIILFFNFYISVAKEESFKKRFLEMALISFGVAALTFGIGYLIRTFFNIEV